MVLFELQDLFLELDLEEVEPALDTRVTGVLPPLLGRRGERPGGRDDSPAGHASDPGENDFEETNAASSVSSVSSEESLLLSMVRTPLKRKEQNYVFVSVKPNSLEKLRQDKRDRLLRRLTENSKKKENPV